MDQGLAVILGVDIGTTHCKAGLFSADGAVLKIASRATVTRRAPAGYAFYDPDELWATVASVIAEANAAADAAQVAAIGLTSMAESGLLVDRMTGAPRSQIIPWFDTASTPQAAAIARETDPFERFRRTGLRSSPKYGLAKLLWIREQDPTAHHAAVWLSVADYIAYRLTGQTATDYSLAARTFAFRIDSMSWDRDWIRHWDFEPDLFPPALPSGHKIGTLQPASASVTGLRPGTPVAISGHDHLCAAVAVGAHQPGVVFDSMGTAESLLGTLPACELAEQEFNSGLSYGRHVAGEHYFWLGGLAFSGGSIEWLRARLAEPPLTYAQLQAMLAEAVESPTGILYFPYLSGSGTPWPDASARAAFIGLGASHTRADILKAVLEGTAYEIEAIRRVAEQTTHSTIERIIAVGGGTRIEAWIRIKADVSGCRYFTAALEEAAVIGAAIIAGAGCGLYADVDQAVAALAHYDLTPFVPDLERHQAYRRLYEEGYVGLQEPLRRYGKQVASIILRPLNNK